MSSVRKHYATDLKVKIVLEMLREEKTVTQLASEYKIHYSQLLKWKKQVLEGLPHLFSDTRTEALKTTHEKEMLALYQEIGQLTTQLAWLKKKSGMN
ncbi:MAG: Putative transposase [Leptospirillum sp. Group II 'C75']|uniref:Putative transposase n=1 Tax=Leptospirillum sp. Group II '5-way CG' TaxID=419541 RepID=B6ARV4_9BACT|nr:transposase [Leptospirillum sp. Group II 'CF-1']AKS24683.1 transposase [Leptospirillum sp. Group II 'CF-1']EAY56961.1 MAG: putative transposase [Leptospirillum rubarum]EDZ38200.1 MAG: Putative transposase [Leptospirillum sp. Group II '5-way CG']EIJ75580.1 MAG: Putative transposase [Leptospirillum sp. Group II 'C75']